MRQLNEILAFLRRHLTWTLIGAIVVVGAFSLGAYLIRGHGNSNGANSSAAASGMSGEFTKGPKMRCPGSTAVVAGDACTVSLHLKGSAQINVTWNTKDRLGVGLRDAAGQDVGSQLTGEKEHVVFPTKDLAEGTYTFRVVNVSDAAGPIDFTVSVAG